MAAEIHAERLALAGVVQGSLQTGLNEPHRAGCHGVAPVVQRTHGDLEPFSLVAEQIPDGHMHVLAVYPASVAGAHAQLAVNAAGGHAREVPLDDETADTAIGRLGPRVRLGEEQEVVGHVRQADPHLLAVEDVVVAFAAGGGAERGHIGARAGLAQREGGDLLASRLGNQVPLPLGFAAPLQECQAVQSYVHRHDDAGGAVHPLQFLAGQRQGEIVHPCSAVAHRDANAQEADGGHLGQQTAIKDLLAVELLDDGADLLLSEVAHRLADHLVFGREREVHGLLWCPQR